MVEELATANVGSSGAQVVYGFERSEVYGYRRWGIIPDAPSVRVGTLVEKPVDRLSIITIYSNPKRLSAIVQID